MPVSFSSWGFKSPLAHADPPRLLSSQPRRVRLQFASQTAAFGSVVCPVGFQASIRGVTPGPNRRWSVLARTRRVRAAGMVVSLDGSLGGWCGACPTKQTPVGLVMSSHSAAFVLRRKDSGPV